MKRGTLPPCRGLFRYGIVALALAGFFELGLGLWIPAKAALAQLLLDAAWSQTRSRRHTPGHDQALTGAWRPSPASVAPTPMSVAPRVKPWPWADTWPLARLVAPRLGRDWIVLAGASGRNLAFAPAHMDGSAAFGASGVSVVAGHRDTHFAALEELEVGDRLEIEQPDGELLGYAITSIEIVDSSRSRLRLDAAQPTLVLVTCYPFAALSAGGPLRYVVTAEREIALARYRRPESSHSGN